MKKDKDLWLNCEIIEYESQQQAEHFRSPTWSSSEAGECGLFKAIFMLRMVYGYSFHYVIEKLQHK